MGCPKRDGRVIVNFPHAGGGGLFWNDPLAGINDLRLWIQAACIKNQQFDLYCFDKY